MTAPSDRLIAAIPHAATHASLLLLIGLIFYDWRQYHRASHHISWQCFASFTSHYRCHCCCWRHSAPELIVFYKPLLLALLILPLVMLLAQYVEYFACDGDCAICALSACIIAPPFVQALSCSYLQLRLWRLLISVHHGKCGNYAVKGLLPIFYTLFALAISQRMARVRTHHRLQD